MQIGDSVCKSMEPSYRSQLHVLFNSLLVICKPSLAYHIISEIGNVTVLENVTTFRVITDHFLRAITFRNDNDLNFDRAIISACDNSSNKLEAILFFHCAKAIGDNANCNIELSL